MRRVFSVIAILSFILLGGVAHAQFSANATALSISMSPTYPKPYDVVTVAPDSNLLNLSASKVTVSINGKAVGAGTGKQSYQVQIGGPGSVNKITMTIVGPDGTNAKTVTIIPADVALVIQPLSTSHPLYKGSPLVAAHGAVRLVAIADFANAKGQHIDPKTLVYNWQLGDQQLQPQSGIGQSVLTMLAPLTYNTSDIQVTVSDQQNTMIAEATETLDPVQPIVRLYEDDALSGPQYGHALTTSYTLHGSEGSFLAVPYFFSQLPSVSWNINGADATQGPVVTVRTGGTGSANASVIANVTGASTLEQGSAGISVGFTGSQSGSIFGNLFSSL